MYQHEEASGSTNNFIGLDNAGFINDLDGNSILLGTAQFFKINNPQTDVWYVKPFWRKTLESRLGATTLYGEYGQYNDQFASNAGSLCGAFDGLFGTNVDHFCNSGNMPNFAVPLDAARWPERVRDWL